MLGNVDRHGDGFTTTKWPTNNGVAPKRPNGAEIDVKRSSGRLVNADVHRQKPKATTQ